MELPNIHDGATAENSVEEEKKSRLVSTSVLLSSESFQPSTETLEYYLKSCRSSEVFLRLMGVLWIGRDRPMWEYIAQSVWNCFLRVSLFAVVIDAAIIAIVIGLSYNTLYYVTLFLQAVTLFFALYDIRHRLKAPITINMKLQLTAGLKTSSITFVLSLVLAIVPILVYLFVVEAIDTLILLFFGEISICCFLSAAMFFILLDCACATSLVEQLSQQLKLELLTFEQYALAREEVERVKVSSSWINNSIVLVAVLDLVSVLLVLIYFPPATNSEFVYLSFFVKEIPFLSVVYWQVAKVNEKSAKFMKTLGSVRWSTEGNRDIERVTIFASAQSQPIEMSLAGMKLKRKDLMWQCGAWCVAFLFGLLKAFVEAHL